MSKKLLILLPISIFLFFFVLTTCAWAASFTEGIQSFGNAVFGSTTTTNPAEIAATIIKGLLGLLGIIFVALILYGGYTWMTGMGKPDTIEKAKKIITAAVIGLVIILLSYAIATFVLNALLNQT